MLIRSGLAPAFLHAAALRQSITCGRQLFPALAVVLIKSPQRLWDSFCFLQPKWNFSPPIPPRLS